MLFKITVLTFVILTSRSCIGKSLMKNSISPGLYRIIGAEGEASLTTGSEDETHLKKVSMKYWNGTTLPAQEWLVQQQPENDPTAFSLVNTAAIDNVLYLRKDGGGIRHWQIVDLRNGQWQIKDSQNERCLKRLGVTVYDEGELCDIQAQSQHWKFIGLDLSAL